MPKISVVIPVFNRAQLISKAIDSVLAQTFSDHEIIIIDDGSTDGSGDIARNYSSGRIKCIRIEHSGTASARNRGIKEAKGKYISFLDSDDTLEPSALADLYEALEADADAGLAYGDFKLTGDPGNVPIGLRRPAQKYSGRVFDKLLMGNFIPCLGTMVRSSCFGDVGLFDESFKWLEDWELFIRISKKYKVIHIDKIVGDYMFHEKNKSFNLIEHNLAKIKVLGSIERKIGIAPAIKIKSLGKIYLALARAYLIELGKSVFSLKK